MLQLFDKRIVSVETIRGNAVLKIRLIFFREERQALLELEDRQRENDKFSKWQHDEDQFHLKQAHLRSNIRIVDGRAKPIDLLAKYISAEEGKFCKYMILFERFVERL